METRDKINLIKSIIRQPYAWPGGYERLAITDDGGILCHKCLKDEYHNVLHSTKFDYRDGWHVVGQATTAELDRPEYCDHCGRNITGVVTFTLPAHWASYLINGDASGYDDDDLQAMDTLTADIIKHHGNAFFSAGDDEPSFTAYHDARHLGVLAADCIEYTIIEDN